MAGNPVNHPEDSGESSAAQPPLHSSDLIPDDIEPVASNSKAIGNPESTSRSDHRHPTEPLRFVESSASSSGDEIAPCDEQGIPIPFKKSHHGKYAYGDRYDLGEYVIEQLSEYDDVDLVKPWHRKLILIHPIVIVWVFLTYAAYYGYRVWCNYQYRLTYGGLDEASWIFICVEGVIMRTYFADITWCLNKTYEMTSTLLVLDGCSTAITR